LPRQTSATIAPQGGVVRTRLRHNAGGIIKVCYEYLHKPDAEVEPHVRGISATLAEIFARADREGLSTSRVADEVAEARFKR